MIFHAAASPSRPSRQRVSRAKPWRRRDLSAACGWLRRASCRTCRSWTRPARSPLCRARIAEVREGGAAVARAVPDDGAPGSSSSRKSRRSGSSGPTAPSSRRGLMWRTRCRGYTRRGEKAARIWSGRLVPCQGLAPPGRVKLAAMEASEAVLAEPRSPRRSRIAVRLLAAFLIVSILPISILGYLSWRESERFFRGRC